MSEEVSMQAGVKGWLAKDALASVVVFLVALPLCMGVAIASGVPPTSGLITGIVGGVVVGFLAGSPFQVSGPAAGLTVLIWALVQQHGLAMLGVIVLLAGLIQIAAGLLKLGQWFRAVSPAVIHGMLIGIGLLILTGQFHVMLDGKPLGGGLDNLLAMPGAVADAFAKGGTTLQALGIGVLSIAVMAVWGKFAPKRLKVLPAPLVALIVSMSVAAAYHLKIKYVSVPENIWSVIQLPSLAILRHAFEMPILIAAFSVAFIASAETLLCAGAVDQMHQGERTKYDKELTAQGIGNAICGIFGVLPMTGVIVRSSANIEAGAKTRASAIMHGLWLLLFAAVLPFTLRLIPVSSLAAVLVFTGYKLAYPKAIPKLLEYGKSEAAIATATVVTIVATDLLKGVVFGLLLSLFKLLYVFSQLDIECREEADDSVHLRLSGSATLIGLPKLAAALDQVRQGAELHVHFENLQYIDHACLDLLGNWEKQHEATNGKLVLEWEELSWKFHQRRSGVRKAAV
jgi:MFS superfamily sulfate permease-like transporter